MAPKLVTAAAVAVTAVAVALPATAPAAKRCANKKEAKGCKLPVGATYRAGDPSTTKSSQLQIDREFSRAQGFVPVTCTGGPPGSTRGGDRGFPVDRKLDLPGRLKVGRTYRSRWQFDTVSSDGRTRSTADYRVKVTIKGAKRATIRFDYDLASGPAEPTPESSPPHHCTGAVTRTAKRVL